MKSFTAALVVGLAAAASAAPKSHAKRQDLQCIRSVVTNPSQTDTAGSINQWFNDVTTVNTFLDSVGTISDPNTLKQATEQVIVSAKDEPCQLTTLTSNSDFSGTVTAAFDCAKQDLGNVFGNGVISNLQTIIDNANNTAVVTQAVADINNVRCCNVLPDASIIWLDSADDNGISNQVPTCAPRPEACSSITCTESCQLDNGVFGSSTSSC